MNQTVRCTSVVALFAVEALLRAAEPPSTPSEPTPQPPAEASPASMPQVVVTATRTAESSFDLPFATATVTREEMDDALPRTFPEALKGVPGVMLQKTANGQGSPFIRGFTGFRNLLLIDGVRLNNSVFRDGPNQYWNTVDLGSVGGLEVVKGPASVLYGSDAIGGTVNALTVSRQSYEAGFNWDRKGAYRVASAESSHSARGEISGNWDQHLGFVAGGSWKSFGDLRGGDEVGRQPETGYTEMDWDAKAEYFLKPGMRLVVAHQTVDQDDIWRTHSTTSGLLWEGTTRGTDLQRVLDQNRDLTYVQFHAETLPGAVREVHLNLSYHLQQEQEFRVRSNRRRQNQGFDVDTLGTFLHLRSPSPIGDWVYGAEYYRDWVNSFATRYNADGSFERHELQGPVGDDSSYDLAGVFVQDTIPLGDRFELSLGGRYNYAGAVADKVADPVTGGRLSLDDHWDQWVGNGRGLVRLDQAEHWHLFAGASQGFRAPNLSDLTRLDVARSGELEVPTLNLEPEKYLTVEGGIKGQFSKASFQAEYFYTDIDGMIIRTPTGRTILVQGVAAAEVTKMNSGAGYIHGVELGASYRFHPQWTARSAFTWMDGKADVYPATSSVPVLQSEYVSRLMPLTFELGLRWEHPSKKYWADAGWTIAAKQDKLSSADQRDTERIPPGGTPGYSVYTLRAGWRPIRNLNVTAAVENLTDEDYRIHGSGLNEPGRNFVLAMDYKF